jgi:multidrug resistance efflux pump
MVVANYRERSLERLRPGQRALVTFRAAPGRIYEARVFALGWGVSQGQGVPSGNLPEVPRLQNWVPPSQRFQVRLALDDPGAAPLRVGTTCTVTTIADPASPIMPLTRFIHEFVALWYYF